MGNNMNEKIRELAKQADLIQWDILPSGARTPDHESVVKARKFANLIVNETIKVIQATAAESVDLDRTLVENVSWTINDIKKHFGVEE
jgi:hypothetical protein